jgi:ATP-dependent Clp protease ATP-binding subunit ClpC
MASLNISWINKLSKNAKLAFQKAIDIALKQGSKEVELDHVFIAILSIPDSLAARTLESMGIDVNKTKTKFFDEKKKVTRKRKSPPIVSPDILDLLRESYVSAQAFKHVYIGTEHLFLALLETNSKIAKELREGGIKPAKFKNHLFNLANYPIGLLVKPDGMNDQSSSSNSLNELGIDLTELAKAGKLDPIVGREEEIDRVIKILSRRRKNNPIIVGEAGVGKTALVEGLAQRIAVGEVPPSLKGLRVVLISVSDIVAGSKMRGDMEEKIMNIIREVSSAPNTVIFIDEIHTLLETGGGGGIDLGQIMKPALVSGTFRVIGATTTAEYTRIFEEDVALNRRFQPVTIEEATKEDTIKILKRLKPILEAHHQIKITPESVEEAVKLSDRYITDRFLPDKAIDLLDEATASKRLEIESKYSRVSDLQDKMLGLSAEKDEYLQMGNIRAASKARKQELDLQTEIKKMEKHKKQRQNVENYKVLIEDIRKVLSSWTGIPVTTLTEEETETLIRLGDTLGSTVIGQPEAVASVANAIKRSRVGIVSKDRPLASFLFLGPTGVGKTELAKQLTKVLFGDERNLIQLDMSEMMEMHSVSKLIGSPPGYIGYKEGGQLTERIRQKPYSVVLFDEIEKAHPDILNILLQILEYGHLTDSKGRKVSFKNSVIILTSNIGAEEIRTDKVLGFKTATETTAKSGVMTKIEADRAYESMKSKLSQKLKNVLRPELLNRLDDVVIFRSLMKKDAERIVKLLIDDLNFRLKELGSKVGLDSKAIDYLIAEGFSAEYGARPLRRIIQDKVEAEISDILLANKGKGKESSIKIKVTSDKEKLVFKVS